jgi:hypothetical protein
MSDSPENITAPPRSIPEFSTASYSSVYESLKRDADVMALKVKTGGVDYIEGIKPLVLGESYIGEKMGTDPAILPWDKRMWGNMLSTGEPDATVANTVVEAVLNYSGQTKVENLDERKGLLRKLEAELIDESQYSWKINTATRQDAFYRLQFMREVIERVTGTDTNNAASPEVVKAREVAQNLRYMQSELSQFLAAKRPKTI